MYLNGIDQRARQGWDGLENWERNNRSAKGARRSVGSNYISSHQNTTMKLINGKEIRISEVKTA